MQHRLRLVLLVLVIALFANVAATAAPVNQQAQYATPVAIVNTSFLNIRTGPGVQYSVLITVVGGTSLQVMGIAPDGVWLQVSTAAGLGWVNVQYTLPRGNFEFVPVVQPPAVVETAAVATYSGSTNNTDDTAVDMGFSSSRLWGASLLTPQAVYLNPDKESLKLQDVGASDGIIYRVVNATLADGIPWVQLQFNSSLTAWVDQNHVIFRPYGCGYTVVRITHDFILKPGPDGSGTEVGIKGGHEAYLLDRVGDAFKLELQSGAIGWADISPISIRDEATVSKPPCVGAATVTSNDAAQGGTGQPESAPVPVVQGPYVVVNTGYLNIRSGAGAQYQPVATVPGGTRLAVVGVAPDGVWYLVEGSFGRGWLNIEFALFRGDGRNLPIVRDTVGTVAAPTGTYSATVTLYAAPNLTLGVVGTIQGPGSVDVIGRTADGNWLQVSSPIGNGWVQRLLITVVGDMSRVPVIN